MAVTGVPHHDFWATKVDQAEEEAELRNHARDLGKDHALTAGQKATLMDAIRAKLEAIHGQKPAEHFGKDGWKETGKAASGDATGGEVASASSEDTTPIPPSEELTLAAPNEFEGLPTRKVRDPLMPVTNATALRAAFDAWRQTTDSLIDPVNDLSTIHGKKYYNITFWRKVAVAYGIEAWPKKRTLVLRDGVLIAEVEMTVRAPGGRACQSFGIASKAEAKLKDASDHDLQARAWSRAYVRGMRDLIGFGAPSAEEMEE